MKKGIIIFSLTLYTCLLFSQADTSNIKALKAIYNATNGNEWTLYHWDFLDSHFYGVETYKKKIVEISMEPNNITGTLPSEIALLSDLKTLSLSSGICVEHNEFLRLEQIDLLMDMPCENRNHLKSIAPEIGQLKKLKTLCLDGNDLDSLPKEIGDLCNLSYLDISWNNISLLPKETGNLYKLKGLNVSGNRLVEVPSEMGRIKKIKTLNLNYNQLVTIPKEIGTLANLEILTLHYNKIETIPDEICNLKKLKKLDLSKNKISQLPEGLTNLKKLKELDITGNQLTFKDIEPLIGRVKDFSYEFQANVGIVQTIETEVGQDVELKFEIGGQHSVYKWYKNGNYLFKTNNDSLVIKNVTTKDTGTYVCEITNTIATGLFLATEPIKIVVNQMQDGATTDTSKVNNQETNADKTNISELQEEGEAEKDFLDFYIENIDGDEISEYYIGDTIFLVIKTVNSIGSEYTIKLGKHKNDFVYDGSVVKGSIKCVIKSDLDRVALVIVEKQKKWNFLIRQKKRIFRRR